MHELSVAQNIIEIVKENVPEKDLGDVKTIFLEVGEFSGIVSDSLQYCFDVIKTDTPLGNSKMEIKKIPFLLYCNKCKSKTTNNMGIRFCECCGSCNTKIMSGMDMQITKVELNS
ncbi:MAG: hydrogenase maturation nickel metallochaperone HypA [Ignavibacteriae bacterium]|nr:hydrogenase maturation nickel metallochaperone HypA [Ignavibacteriota bacterium]